MRFDLDTQRCLVCIAGLVFLGLSLLAVSLGAKVPDIFPITFGALALGPIAEGTVTRYRQMKRGQRDEEDR